MTIEEIKKARAAAENYEYKKLSHQLKLEISQNNLILNK